MLSKAGNLNHSATFNMSSQGVNNSSTFKRSQSKVNSTQNALRLNNAASGMDKKSSGISSLESGPSPPGSSTSNGNQQTGSSLDLGAYPISHDDEILDKFFEDENDSDHFFEGQCYLKTKTDRFKEHWAVLLGNDIFCYRNQDDRKHRVMHCLAGTFIKEISEEQLKGLDSYKSQAKRQ